MLGCPAVAGSPQPALGHRREQDPLQPYTALRASSCSVSGHVRFQTACDPRAPGMLSSRCTCREAEAVKQCLLQPVLLPALGHSRPKVKSREGRHHLPPSLSLHELISALNVSHRHENCSVACWVSPGGLTQAWGEGILQAGGTDWLVLAPALL